tara:strand:- start:1112 stop:2224 length:1113 start_codon:yes stop_codon:yes gene_type:complete
MISIISSSHYPDDERIFHKQIQALITTGYFVYYFTRSDQNKNLSSSYIKHQNFSSKVDISNYIKSIYNIITAIPKIRYIQIHETELLPLFKLIKQKENSVVTIYDVHENMEALYRTFSNRIKPIKEIAIKIRKIQEKRYLKYVDKTILANPPISKRYYLQYGDQTNIIENFPELKFIQRKYKSNNDNNTKIIYHGHLGPERGIDVLVMAMVDVINFFPEASLTLIGTFRTTHFKDKIHYLINELGLSNSVQILDQISYTEIWSILKIHSIGVIPFVENHLTKENTPTKLFEMMSVGLKIVCSDLPPIRNFVNNSVYWANPGNVLSLSKAIINASASSGNEIIIEKNKQLIKEKYNWENKKTEYLSLFNSQ